MKERNRQTLRKFLDGIKDRYENNQWKLLKISRMGQMVWTKESGHQINQEQPHCGARRDQMAIREL